MKILIGATVLKKQILELGKFINECRLKLKLPARHESSQNINSKKLSEESETVLSAIFNQVAQLPIDVTIFLLLTKLATNLIAADQLEEAVHVCAYIRTYCVELPKRKQTLTCGENLSMVFEKELTDPDGSNSYVLDATMKELKSLNYQNATARRNVASSTFEEHFFKLVESNRHK